MKVKILKVKDKTDKFVKKKKKTFDLPLRLLLISKSGGGKSSIIFNFLAQENPEFYSKDYEPENIFIFSNSLKGDAKIQTLIKHLDIPKENLFGGYDEGTVEVVYDMLVDNFNDAVADKEKPQHSLLIFDDISFDGSLKGKEKASQMNRIFMNGRKFLISVIATAQKYTDLGTGLRENATGLILGKSSNKQIEAIEADHNYLKERKMFRDMFLKYTGDPFSFLIINFSKKELYFDKDFEPVHMEC